MAENSYQFKPIRRIVAGNDESGKSVIISDGEATNSRQTGIRRSTLIWATKETPADFLNHEDAGQWI